MGDVLMPLAIVGLILLAGSRNDRIVPFRRMNASASLHIPLILELLAVALRQGSSITRALDTVAQVVDVGLGTAVGKVTASLHQGVAWSESWALVCDDASYVGQACIVLRAAHACGISSGAAVDQTAAPNGIMLSAGIRAARCDSLHLRLRTRTVRVSESSGFRSVAVFGEAIPRGHTASCHAAALRRLLGTVLFA
ncbi:MAG: hypothetical protein L0J23_03065 [Bifidobacterium crudilactis]|nr:hypothetical protein [Bifidobacterium crudilactis]